jgi:hypothetical protein
VARCPAYASAPSEVEVRPVSVSFHSHLVAGRAEEEPSAWFQHACHGTEKLLLVDWRKQEDEPDRYDTDIGAVEESAMLRWLTGGGHIRKVAPAGGDEGWGRIDSPDGKAIFYQGSRDRYA